MGIIGGRLKEGVVGKGANALAHVSFVSSLAVSSITTIWALYINSFVNNNATTGLISGVLTFISFISFFAFVPLIEKYDSRKLFSFSLVFSVLAYILFALNENFRSFYFFLIIAVGLTAISTIRVSASGVILKNNSKDKEISKNEGLMYTFLNLGWVIGPLAAGWLASRFGFSYVFIPAAGFAFLSLIMFKLTSFKDCKKSEKGDGFFESFFNFFRSKDRIIAYFVGGGITAWWVLIYLFIPLYMVNRGYGADYVGYFLFAVAIPLIFLEYLFGKLAAKWGYRGIFLIGTFLVSAFTIMCVFTMNDYILFFLIIMGCVGMAMLEPTTEAYFLHITKKRDTEKYFGPYNTSRDVCQFVGKMIPSLFLLALPFRLVFVFFAGYMGVIFLISFFVKE